MEVLSIRSTTYSTITDCDQALLQLNNLQSKAFEQLVAEKLTADESFRIFTDLLKQTIEIIRERKHEVSKSAPSEA